MHVAEYLTFGVLFLSNFAWLIRMYVKLEDLLEWRRRVESHLSDITIHIDPRRDEDKWKSLYRTLEKMDQKLDNIYLLERGDRKSNKGDADDK